MAKYKVIALNCSGKGNKVHYAGEELSEDAFAPGHAEKLVKEGFLEKVGAKKPEAPKLSAEEQAEKDAFDAVTKAEIKAKLTEAKVEFDEKANKTELWDLLKASQAGE